MNKAIKILGGISILGGLSVFGGVSLVDHVDIHIGGNDPTPTYVPTPTITMMNSTPTAIPVIETYYDEQSSNDIENNKAVDNILTNYLSNMVKAINENDFSYVETLLKNGSKAYNEQKGYILEYCQQNQIKAIFKNVQILSSDNVSNTLIKTTVLETFQLNSPQKGNRENTLQTIYTLENINGMWLVSSIENITGER